MKDVKRWIKRSGNNVSRGKRKGSTGDALLRLASLGEKSKVKAPADLSSRIDDYLYGDDTMRG